MQMAKVPSEDRPHQSVLPQMGHGFVRLTRMNVLDELMLCILRICRYEQMALRIRLWDLAGVRVTEVQRSQCYVVRPQDP